MHVKFHGNPLAFQNLLEGTDTPDAISHSLLTN
jgi:hypothetical protein